MSLRHLIHARAHLGLFPRPRGGRVHASLLLKFLFIYLFIFGCVGDSLLHAGFL